MAGKNGSTTCTAPAAVAEASDWQSSTCAAASEAARAGCEAKKTQSSNNRSERQSTMDTQRPSHDRKAPRGMLDRSLQAQLGRQLRSIFSDVASEPVPERFIKLLEELEAKEKRR